MARVGYTLKHTWHGTYFHGDLEDEVIERHPDLELGAPDIVTSDVLLSEVAAKPGKYTVEFYGREVHAYLIPGYTQGLRGLIVDPKDTDSVAYAEDLLRTQPRIF